MIARDVNLKEAKGVKTPCEDEKEWLKDENGEELNEKDKREYRGIAARANDLAMDRPDIQFATKEVCRGMARPTQGDWRKLKRLGRYLVGRMWTIMRYPWQGDER